MDAVDLYRQPIGIHQENSIRRFEIRAGGLVKRTCKHNCSITNELHGFHVSHLKWLRLQRYHSLSFKTKALLMQRTLTFTQRNVAPPDRVFPLLCPVREAEWLDGWAYKMVHSNSGLIELNCVFLTPHHGAHPTVWQVTEYDPASFQIEFIRVTPGEVIVQIQIQLTPAGEDHTHTHIAYRYTPLSEQYARYVEQELPQAFDRDMQWWEKAINHYLKTGHKLMRQADARN